METLIILFLIFYSIVLHEISHGYVAYRLGDPTAKYEGRLSLNPLVHIDPLGTILLPLFTYVSLGFVFGYAKPVPYNPENLKDKIKDPILIALAGPITNIFILLFFLFLYKQNLNPLINEISFNLIKTNLVLALFNLLPIPPLDGSKLYLLFMPLESYILLEAYGFAFIILFLLFFQNAFFYFINKIFLFLISS
jgi:Zn-dependent protease